VTAVASVVASGAKTAPDNTALYLIAAIIIAAMVIGYLAWRERHATRNRDRTNDEGDMS
jgi:cell division protein FtsL